jgi:hypothetical protein
MINVRTKLGDQERDAASHEATDEVNVAAETVQLGNGYEAAAVRLSARG